MQTTLQRALSFVFFALFQFIPAIAEDKSLPATTEILKGDFWQYQMKDEITGTNKGNIKYTVTDIDQNSITAKIEWSTTPAITNAFYDLDWNIVDDLKNSFKPSSGMSLPHEIKVGSEWKTLFDWKSDVGAFAGKGKSIGICPETETITNITGTYDTLHCVVHTEIGAIGTLHAVQIESNTWYAPGLARWVKQSTTRRVDGHLTEQFSFDLVSFNILGSVGVTGSSSATVQTAKPERPKEQSPPATGVTCNAKLESTTQKVVGKVMHFVSKDDAARATKSVENQIGAKVSPAFANLQRVYIVAQNGSNFETMAALQKSMNVQIGDWVEVESRHRDPELSCNFIPWTVNRIVKKAN